APTLLRALGQTAPDEESKDRRATPTWDPATVVAFTPWNHWATASGHDWVLTLKSSRQIQTALLLQN
ncbi:Hypothetical predicted protein, partial [Pelobates cultripes]